MKKGTACMLGIVVVLAAGVAGTYVAIGMHYQEHFFEHTRINGIDVSDLTAAQAEALIAAQTEDYRVTVTTREGTEEVIEGENIGYQFVSGGEVQGFLEEQNVFAWLPAYFGEGISYTMEASVTYDEQLLTQAVDRLNCMQEDQITPPADAYVQKQEDGTYGIVAEVQGNEPDVEKVQKLLKETVDAGGSAVNLEESDCYLSPTVYADDGALKAEAAVMNRYTSLTVTYYMGGGVTEVLDSATIAQWFSLDENKQPVIDREAVAQWVNQLADQYDTLGTALPFTTSNGATVYVEARTYGWQMDRESETEALYQQLLSGESAERSPVWFESAAGRGQNDIGNTYVEIDYTNQRMWYYKEGNLLVETPVVTGNVSAGMASPEGIFCIVYKEEDAILKGEDYETPVDYWMPFYEGVGIHDADSWRTTYGGDVYQWSGSHGCINTPTAQAAIIYENIEPGTPVICYSSGTNYGYSQVQGSGTSQAGNGVSGSSTAGDGSGSTAGEGDIVIIDGGDQDVFSDSGEVVIDDTWVDGTADSSESGWNESMIDIGEWDEEVVYYSDEMVIY